MTRAGIVRTISWVQMVVSIILAMAITATYFAYRTSLADYSRALAESILSVSNVLTITAERMTARQDLLQDAQNALKSTRDVVEVLKRAYSGERDRSFRLNVTAAQETVSRG